jgi:hypothetical protein
MGAAVTYVAAHSFTDFRILAGVAFFDLHSRRHDLARCAMAELEPVMMEERCLDRVQRVGPGADFDRSDRLPVAARCKRQARDDLLHLRERYTHRTRRGRTLFSHEASILAQHIEDATCAGLW